MSSDWKMKPTGRLRKALDAPDASFFEAPSSCEAVDQR
jgi:hypothetical protein